MRDPIYVFTAKVPEQGRQVIECCDNEPTIEEQWAFLREYVRMVLGVGEENNTYVEDEDAVTQYLSNFCESDFEVEEFQITKIPLGEPGWTAPPAENQSTPNA